MMIVRSWFSALVLLVALALPAMAASPEVEDAWVRPTFGEGRMTAGYMEITNPNPAPDALIAVSSERAGRIEIHETTMTEDGTMRMREAPDGIWLPPSGTVLLEPGGLHLMVMMLDGPVTADAPIDLTLTFESGAEVTVQPAVSMRAPE